MTTRLVRLNLALILTALVPSMAAAQTGAPKLDESLRETVANGCVGTRPVIIRTKPGYREGLRASLQAHGDIVKGEFPALDALAAEVHCDDLTTLAGFSSTNSVSLNGPVGVQSLLDGSLTTDAQLAVTAAKANLAAAKANASAAQSAVRSKEDAAATVQAQLVAAQKAVTAANKLSGAAKTLALAAANAKVVAAQADLKTALDALNTARTAATVAQAAALAAQDKLNTALNALSNISKTIAAREREGEAARSLKRKFFVSMALDSDLQTATEDQLDSTPSDDSKLNAFGTTSALTGGGNIGIAIIDSGIEPGVDFGDRIAYFYDFTQGDVRATAPSDGYGHGTHVAGLAASKYVGIAPMARLIGLKVLDDKGRGTTDNVVRAIEFAVTNKALLGIDVLNLSLGHPIFEPAATDPLVQAVEHATRAGITVVVSVGNFGMSPKTGQPAYAGVASPGNAPSALSVGAAQTFNTATRTDDRIAPYSSRGPSWYDGFAKPDFVAPGDNLLSVAAANSTLRIAQEKRGNTGDYMRLSGTSMAAAVASGVAALVLQSNHGLTPNTVKAVLEYSSIPVLNDLGKSYDPLTQGTGQIEVAGAVAFAQAIHPNVAVGGSWLSTTLTPSTTITGHSYSWAQSILWGNRRVAGAKLLAEQRPAWALNIVWGEGMGSEDDNIVWGNNFGDDDNIVWGNSLDVGDNIVWGNNFVWGSSLDDDNIVWGNLFDDDNIVWGNLFGDDDNIVWGNNVVWGDGLIGMAMDDDNIVWGNALGEDDNIVWGNLDDDNIVWGNLFDDNIVWGNSLDDDNIVWGNSLGDDDNIVWGNSAQLGNVINWSGGQVKSGNRRGRRSIAKKGVN
jgi:serine protease AprX